MKKYWLGNKYYDLIFKLILDDDFRNSLYHKWWYIGCQKDIKKVLPHLNVENILK